MEWFAIGLKVIECLRIKREAASAVLPVHSRLRQYYARAKLVINTLNE